MLRFGNYTLDIEASCLRTDDGEIVLRPKTFEVLRCLVGNAGRLVSKDELLQFVWPNVIVTDESLMQCVSEIRQAIGDSRQTIIKTVPRRGYRFAAPVTRVEARSIPAPGADLKQVQPGTGQPAAPAPSERPSIAVLPFVNLGGDPQQEYFSDGITEDIMTELSRFSELLVISRNSTFQYKGRAIDARQVGRELGVRYVLEGSIRRAGDRVRVNAQLVEAMTGAQRWAERYDREVQDVFAVQDEVVRTIATILAVHVIRAETERTLLEPPATWEAYDYYLRGVEANAAGLSEATTASLYEGRRLLEKALSLDPGYARAYAVLARSHVTTYLEPYDGAYLDPAGLNRAHELAQKAVRLEPNLPQARVPLGFVLLFRRLHEAAIAEFEQALSLNPNFTDPIFGLGLVYAGQPSRAIEVLQANLRLDPFRNAARLAYMGNAYYMLRRYAEAVPPLRECATRMPNLRISHLWLAAAYAQLGQLAEAKAEAAEVLRIEPNFAIDRWKCTAVYKDRNDTEHLLEGLRKAGLPE